MKEFFLYGILCVATPEFNLEQCNYFYEDPQKFYTLEECKVVSEQKVNEIGLNLTSKGVVITKLQIACVVDNTKQNTWFHTYKLIR